MFSLESDSMLLTENYFLQTCFYLNQVLLNCSKLQANVFPPMNDKPNKKERRHGGSVAQCHLCKVLITSKHINHHQGEEIQMSLFLTQASNPLLLLGNLAYYLTSKRGSIISDYRLCNSKKQMWVTHWYPRDGIDGHFLILTSIC